MSHLFEAEIDPMQECSGQSVTVIHLTGSLDAQSMADCDQLLADPAVSGARYFILDMANVEYVSSAGLRSLLKFRKAAAHAGGRLKLAGVHREIRENVLDALGFSRLMDICGDVAEAMESIKADVASNDN
jgi:anti-anti-sigma factor